MNRTYTFYGMREMRTLIRNPLGCPGKELLRSAKRMNLCTVRRLTTSHDLLHLKGVIIRSRSRKVSYDMHTRLWILSVENVFVSEEFLTEYVRQHHPLNVCEIVVRQSIWKHLSPAFHVRNWTSRCGLHISGYYSRVAEEHTNTDREYLRVVPIKFR